MCMNQFQTANSYLMGVTKWVIFWNIPERENETPERFWQDGSPVGCKSFSGVMFLAHSY